MRVAWALVPLLVFALHTPAQAMDRWTGDLYEHGERDCTPIASTDAGWESNNVCSLDRWESGSIIDYRFESTGTPEALLPTVFLAMVVEDTTETETDGLETADDVEFWYDLDKFTDIGYPEIGAIEVVESEARFSVATVSMVMFQSFLVETVFDMPLYWAMQEEDTYEEVGLGDEILYKNASVPERIEGDAVVWTLF